MARVRELAGLPIAQHSSPNVGGRMSGHRGVVLHIAEGYYQGTVSWQMNADQRYADGTRVTTSSTWIVGRDRGQWAQMVDTDTVAWAQRSGSHTWLSIELAGFRRGHQLNPGGWEKPTAWQIEACAQLLAWAHRQHGIPLQLANSPSGRGLGYHSMGAPAWGHSACPGPDIIAQRATILARARTIVEEDDVSAEDVWNYRIPRRELTRGDWPHLSDTVRAQTVTDAIYRFARWARNYGRDAAQAAERNEETLQAVLSAVAGDSLDTIVAKLDAHHAEKLAALKQHAEQLDAVSDLLESLPDAVAAELGDRDQDAVAAAVERVLARLRVSVDDETSES